jgi:hypothetical protein
MFFSGHAAQKHRGLAHLHGSLTVNSKLQLKVTGKFGLSNDARESF